MRIKSITLSENGDFDITVSFSKEEIRIIGADTTYGFEIDKQKGFLEAIWFLLRKELADDDKRTLKRASYA